MTTVKKLTRAAYGIHIADQIALVSVPLVAALAFDAPAEVIGLLIACQSMAHLLGSIPFGILVDTQQKRTLAIAATLISSVGFLGAAAAILIGSLLWFGASVVLAGFGIVLFMLTTLSILPKVVAPAGLGAANASIELPRALASFAVPLCIGVVIMNVSSHILFLSSAVATAFACVFVVNLPKLEVVPNTETFGVFRKIFDGGKFVMKHQLLRAVLLCAVFWNFAFSALLVTMVPLIREVYFADAGTFGIALASFGAGAIAGSWISRYYAAQIPPNVILLFGPGISVPAPVMLYTLPAQGPLLIVYAAFFLLGFGPSMWLIAQNSIRQIVSPSLMLGRVNAVIQTSIYGIRPLAAMAAGVLVGASSPQVGLVLVFAGFLLSFITAAFSSLRRVKSYTEIKTTEAT